MTRRDGLSEDALLDYAHGKAKPEQAAEIEAAAADDPALRAELALMAGLKGALATSGDAPDSRAFGWKRLEAEIGKTDRKTRAPTRAPTWRIAAAFLGAVVLALSVVR